MIAVLNRSAEIGIKSPDFIIISVLISYPHPNLVSLRQIQDTYVYKMHEIIVGSGFQPYHAVIFK